MEVIECGWTVRLKELSLKLVEFLAHGKQPMNGDFYLFLYIEGMIYYSLLEVGGLILF